MTKTRDSELEVKEAEDLDGCLQKKRDTLIPKYFAIVIS